MSSPPVLWCTQAYCLCPPLQSLAVVFSALATGMLLLLLLLVECKRFLCWLTQQQLCTFSSNFHCFAIWPGAAQICGEPHGLGTQPPVAPDRPGII